MTRAWLNPMPQAHARRESVASAIPVLTTDRLILRAPRIEDWPTLEPIWITKRAEFIGGPFNEEDAWLDFSQTVAAWVLRGVGYWTVTLKSDGSVLGLSGLGQETLDPEPEFGWLFTESAEGHGYATEATKAIRDYLFAQGHNRFVSYIDAAHSRSITLAERLGARRDASETSANPPYHVYRHIAPEAHA